MDPRLAIHASVARDTLFATRVHLPPSTDHQALRASQRGPCASRHFTCLPTSQETRFTSEEFRTLMLVRLHLPPVSMFTDWAFEATGDSRRSVHGANLPRSRRSRQGESTSSQCHRSCGRSAPDRGHCERPSILWRQAGCHRHYSGFNVDWPGHGEGSEARPGHPRGGTGQVPKMSRVGQREPVPFARDGFRGGRAVEHHSRNLSAKSGLVQVFVWERLVA